MKEKVNKKSNKLFSLKYGTQCPKTGRIFVSSEELEKLKQDKKVHRKLNNN